MTTTTAERPILFKSEMVRAILDGRKTQTRRVIQLPKWSTGDWEDFDTDGETAEVVCEKTTCCATIVCPYGKAGDILWVKETWQQKEAGCDYAANYNESDRNALKPWKPSIFMPFTACRLRLKIVDVRIERLQDISDEDAIAEGIEVNEDGYYKVYGVNDCWTDDPYISFCSLWESINGFERRQSNPWVWAIKFNRLGGN